MRTSYFYTPYHYSKICDIIVESIIQLYTNTNQIFESNLFAYKENDNFVVKGWISSINHFTDEEILDFIKLSIEIECNVKFEFYKKIKLDNETEINSGVFLGHSNSENKYGIPFEHFECINLSKYIFDLLKIPLKTMVTINGKQIDVYLETNYDNKSDLKNICVDFLDKDRYGVSRFDAININILPFFNKDLYISNRNFIPNTYGPRASYGNLDFVGFGIYNNSKISHLICKEIADYYLKSENLNYCSVEISYQMGNPNPIQFGVKGNQGGIYIENGTFFKYMERNEYKILDEMKNKIIFDLKSSSNKLIEMAKWGYLNYKD